MKNEKDDLQEDKQLLYMFWAFIICLILLIVAVVHANLTLDDLVRAEKTIQHMKQDSMFTKPVELPLVEFTQSDDSIKGDLIDFVSKINVPFDTLVYHGAYPGSGSRDTVKVANILTSDGYEIQIRQSIVYPSDIKIVVER